MISVRGACRPFSGTRQHRIDIRISPRKNEVCVVDYDDVVERWIMVLRGKVECGIIAWWIIVLCGAMNYCTAWSEVDYCIEWSGLIAWSGVKWIIVLRGVDYCIEWSGLLYCGEWWIIVLRGVVDYCTAWSGGLLYCVEWWIICIAWSGELWYCVVD